MFKRTPTVVSKLAFLVALIAGTHTGCAEFNPDYCEADSECNDGFCDTTTNGCTAACQRQDQCNRQSPICEADTGRCRACMEGPVGDAECASRDPGAPACSAGVCVMCTENDHCGEGQRCTTNTFTCTSSCETDFHCGATTPVCETGLCRGCESHGECASDLCDTSSGACVTTDHAVYVDSGHTSADDRVNCGTPELPCETIRRAVEFTSTIRPFVHVASGSYRDNLALGDTHDITVVAPTGATVTSLNPDSAVAVVRGPNHVILEGLTLIAPSSLGVGCDRMNATITLKNVVIRTAMMGVRAVFCTLDIRDSLITHIETWGVYSALNVLNIQRSTISTSRNGGLRTELCTISAANNLIIDNGGPEAPSGGVYFHDSQGVFEFNTVAGNISADAGSASGIGCQASPVQVRNSIVWNEAAGDCTFQNSVVKTGATGAGVLTVDPVFVAPNASNYHLSPFSPLVNAGTLVANTDGTDIDGDPRLIGQYPDIGADEVTPPGP